MVADVDPDRRVVRRSPARDVEQVLQGEVRGAVEAERDLVRATGEESRRVASDSAEALGLDPAEVERAEAAHRDAADRDAMRIGIGALERGGNRFVKHVRAPAAV